MHLKIVHTHTHINEILQLKRKSAHLPTRTHTDMTMHGYRVELLSKTNQLFMETEPSVTITHTCIHTITLTQKYITDCSASGSAQNSNKQSVTSLDLLLVMCRPACFSQLFFSNPFAVCRETKQSQDQMPRWLCFIFVCCMRVRSRLRVFRLISPCVLKAFQNYLTTQQAWAWIKIYSYVSIFIPVEY